MSPVLDWPFTTKDPSQYQRVDQGWDLQGTPGAPVLAVASGVIEQANPDPSGFGVNYPYEVLDTPVDGHADIYYGHTHVDPALVGQHVAAGQEIATTGTAADPGGEAPAGWLEIGFGANAPDPSSGQTMHDLLIGSAPSATLTGAGAGSPGIFGILTNPAGSLWQEVQPFLAEALLVLFGLGLVVIGAYRLAKPEADRAMETAGKAAPLAEAAA